MCDKPSDNKFHHPDCLKRKCQECGIHKLDLEAFSDIDTLVHWKRWELVEQEIKGQTSKIVKKRALVSKSGTMKDLTMELCEELQPTPRTSFY